MNYYILSLKHSPVHGDALWWGPDNCGYTADLNHAGLYDEDGVRAKPEYYNNGKDTKAIPWPLVKGLTKETMDWGRALGIAKEVA